MKLRMAAIVVVVLAWAAPSLSLAQTDWSAALEREKAMVKAPGVAAAVVSGDGPIWIGVTGLSDLETRRPVTPDTLFQIGSVTKNLTATLMMSMVDDGLIGLDDPVSRHVPVTGPIGAITLRQLAAHTSGLPRNPPNRVDVDGVMRAYSQSELTDALAQTTLASTPGADFRYSNFGYLLLGHALERAGGRRYEELLRERILRPVGMPDTGVQIAPEDEARIAVHYWPSDDPFQARPRWRFGDVAGAAGLTTTIGDLGRYLSFVIRAEAGADVSAATLLSQRVPQTVAPDWRASFGLGWSVWRDDDGSLVVWHEGELDGHSAVIGFSPATEVGVVVLTNLGGPAAPDAGYRLLRQARAEQRAQRAWTVDEGESLFASAQWGDAEVALAKVVERDPSDVARRRMLGAARFQLRDFAGAKSEFERLPAGPERQASLGYLARIAAIRNDTTEAFARLAEARSAGVVMAELEALGEFRPLQADPRWGPLFAPQ